MTGTVLAAAAHPDDIEMMMGGSLILLADAGWEAHIVTIANGCCGSAHLDPEEIIAIRTNEARTAAESIGATYHPPYVNDIEIFYENSLIRRLCALVREVRPDILLLQSPQDYMEDHMYASRLMVTAAFSRGIRNYASDPPLPPIDTEMCVYHALPWGLTDQLLNPIVPHFCVDISDVVSRKRDMLACHVSQKEWLDSSQGVDNYLTTMVEMSRRVGRMSGKFEYAEGWRRHLHLGFGPEDYDPLADALAGRTAFLRK